MKQLYCMWNLVLCISCQTGRYCRGLTIHYHMTCIQSGHTCLLLTLIGSVMHTFPPLCINIALCIYIPTFVIDRLCKKPVRLFLFHEKWVCSTCQGCEHNFVSVNIFFLHFSGKRKRSEEVHFFTLKKGYTVYVSGYK